MSSTDLLESMDIMCESFFKGREQDVYCRKHFKDVNQDSSAEKLHHKKTPMVDFLFLLNKGLSLHYVSHNFLTMIMKFFELFYVCTN